MSWEFPRNATLSIWFNYYFRFKLTTNAEDFSVPGTIGTEIEMGAFVKKDYESQRVIYEVYFHIFSFH